MFGKKTTIEILYNYTISNDSSNAAVFTLSHIKSDNLYYAIMPESLFCDKLETLEKILNHLSQNFYYFLKNNFDFDKLKEEYEKVQNKDKIIGYSSFYYIAEVENGIVIEFPNELVCENVYEMYDWLKNFVADVKRDIQNYKQKNNIK